MSNNVSLGITSRDTLDKIEDSVARIIEGESNDHDKLNYAVKSISSITPGAENITKDEILAITKRLETRFDIKMNIGNLLASEDYIPWIDENRKEINWYYWDRYKRLLPEKKFSREVINVLDLDTDNIIDHLENPKKIGAWKRKGLVVGHVQSGKTANYTGVICKAADAGYKIIIVLAGLLSALRNQTQERIDEGFVGLDSSLQLDSKKLEEKLIGVGKFYDSKTWRTPVPLTTSSKDFDNNMATQLRAKISHFNEPLVFVLKKNVKILENLFGWLNNNNSDLNKYPMLLIDDEADHASIDTSKEDDDPTATNSSIRKILGLFEQSTYLGYTATPFANIFIDPENENEMLKDDLFPRDFILSLDTPTNYVGSQRIFEEDGDLKIIRNVNDHEDVIPIKHKKNDLPETLPQSLYEAIIVFILVKAARNLRGQIKNHNSMLINVSRFTGIQSHVKWQAHEFLTNIRNSINNHYALPIEGALTNSDIRKLKDIWDKEFSNIEFSWNEIQKELKDAVSPIHIIEVNGSKNAEPLDYSKRSYPNGRNVIAIGGMSLSRGLTLEGLTVSYFLRNSIMYDTLMQMGRWFGYRTNFEDLCRIYMTKEASSWYAHISRVTRELRDEFHRMEKAKMTPIDFGLCVRNHPETLIVTAHNKMRSAKPVLMQINLEGRIVETAVLSRSPDVITGNMKAASTLIEAARDYGSYIKSDPSHFFGNVPVDHIESFISSFINHPASQNTQTVPLISYVKWLADARGMTKWDVLLLNKLGSKSSIPPIMISGFSVKAQLRKVVKERGKGIAQENRRIGSGSDELAGLDDVTLKELCAEFGSYSKIPATRSREARKRPLLMIHLIDCILNDKSIDENGLIAYGISFPGNSSGRKPEKLVEYQVNTVWWKNNYSDLLDDEEGEIDE